MLAYRENLNLRNSLVVTYEVYVLKHPDTNEIFYVGQTFKGLKSRLAGHITESNTSNSTKSAYIKSIIETGKKPIIEAVEVINGKCYIDKVFALSRELFWIKYFKDLGNPITNSVGVQSDGEHREYQGYLASIKMGETSWSYYLCGETSDGVQVYDREKIMSDGFKFPESIKHHFNNPWYDPWASKRFNQKLQYESRQCIPDTIDGIKIFKLEEPQWSEEFKKEIPYSCIFCERDYWWDDADYELEEDFEPDCDNEIEHDSEIECDEEFSWQNGSERNAGHIVNYYYATRNEVEEEVEKEQKEWEEYLRLKQKFDNS